MKPVPPQSHVLVVDDDPDSLEILRTILEAHGYGVQGASTVELALQLAAATHFDALITDVLMPGLHGWELIRALSAQGSLPPRIIAMSSLPEEALGPDRGVAHADAFLRKPFHWSELLTALTS